MGLSNFWRVFERRSVQSAVGILLTLAALVSLGFSWKASDDLQDYVVCQQQWNTFFYQAITASRGASDEATEALDNLIDTISTAKSREETATALAKYKEARTKQNESRKNNPLPAPPDQVCKL